MKIKHSDAHDVKSKQVTNTKIGCERVPRFDKGVCKPKNAMASTLSGFSINDSQEEKKMIIADEYKLLEEQKELSLKVLKNEEEFSKCISDLLD